VYFFQGWFSMPGQDASPHRQAMVEWSKTFTYLLSKA
jgi:hypothetical protein